MKTASGRHTYNREGVGCLPDGARVMAREK